jgi:tetratricopeptide (TPR) repeat protein
MAITGLRSFKEVAPLIRAQASKALELDPSEPGPEFLLGIAAVLEDFDWVSAARHFQRALSGPSIMRDARWAYASLYLQVLGRFTESVAFMEKEVEQDPLNSTYRMVLAAHLNHLELYPRAIEELHGALELDETNWAAHFVLAEACLRLGQLSEAVAAAERSRQLAPWNSVPMGLQAAALIRLGERPRAESLIQQMGDPPKPLWGRVVYHLLCSETDAAADWFEKALQHRDGLSIMYSQSPFCRGLRQSPRWPKLAQMMNLGLATMARSEGDESTQLACGRTFPL